MFKFGDRYIHFTKYGGVNLGKVVRYYQDEVFDKENGCVYYENYIQNEKGICLNLDGEDGRIYKIRRDITPKENEDKFNFAKRIFRAKEMLSTFKGDNPFLIH